MEGYEMKRILVALVALCTVMAASAAAQDDGPETKLLLSAYGGFGMGLGDVFDDLQSNDGTWSTTAGMTLGGSAHYFVLPKLGVGVDVQMQTYKLEFEAASAGAFPSADESKLNAAITGSLVYSLLDDGKQAFLLNCGGGMYKIGVEVTQGGVECTTSDEMGFFGGCMYRYMLTNQFGLYFQPRIHVIMADEPWDTYEIVQIAAGVQIPL
jgi:hypothetical protein